MEGLFNLFMTHLSVVIPVHNESSLIKELVKRVKKNIEFITEDFEIILVDDGSKDQTWELIEFESNTSILLSLEQSLSSRNFLMNFFLITAILGSLCT